MVPDSMVVAGIDIGKTWLDIACHPSGGTMRVENSPAGHRVLANWMTEQKVERIGLEASGGYERGVVAALRDAGFEVAVLQPRQVRAFALFRLKLAKNDRLDAALIARCTAELDTVRAAPDPRLELLAEHVRLVDLARRLALIESVQGIGRRTALNLLILMPELGRLTRGEIASLASLAPFDRDSGHHRGQRRIAGGRHRIRRALYAAALPASFPWNPALVDTYERLRANGKNHKQALTACARKLLTFANAVLARGAAWATALNGC